MHELLAPLVYVMRRDREAFTAALAAGGEGLKEVANREDLGSRGWGEQW